MYPLTIWSMSSVVYFMSKDPNASSLLDTSFLRIFAFCCTNASSISSPCPAAASTLSKRLYGRQTAFDFSLGRSSGGVTCDICVSEPYVVITWALIPVVGSLLTNPTLQRPIPIWVLFLSILRRFFPFPTAPAKKACSILVSCPCLAGKGYRPQLLCTSS